MSSENLSVERLRIIEELHSLAAQAAGRSLATREDVPVVDFANVFQSSLGGVAKAEQRSQQLQQQYELGESGAGLSDVMLAIQKASLMFHLTSKMTEKFTGAYREIMNMQS